VRSTITENEPLPVEVARFKPSSPLSPSRSVVAWLIVVMVWTAFKVTPLSSLRFYAFTPYALVAFVALMPLRLSPLPFVAFTPL